jgi:hypothetical protein
MNEVAIHQFELLDLTHIETNTTLLSNVIILKLTLPRKRRHYYIVWYLECDYVWVANSASYRISKVALMFL